MVEILVLLLIFIVLSSAGFSMRFLKNRSSRFNEADIKELTSIFKYIDEQAEEVNKTRFSRLTAFLIENKKPMQNTEYSTLTRELKLHFSGH